MTIARLYCFITYTHKISRPKFVKKQIRLKGPSEVNKTVRFSPYYPNSNIFRCSFLKMLAQCACIECCSDTTNVILMRFFFIRYVKTSFVNFGPRPLFHQWPPGGALAVNSVNKSLFHGQFLGTRPKSNAILVFKAISNFVNF